MTSETVVGRRSSGSGGVVEMRSVETSEQAMGPGAGTRHLVTLAIQDFKEMVKVAKPGPYFGSRSVVARAEAVKILDHDMVMAVEYQQDDDEAAVVCLRWSDVPSCDRIYKELVRLDKFRVTVRGVRVQYIQDEDEEDGMMLGGWLYKEGGEWWLGDGEFKVELEIETSDFTNNLNNPLENGGTTKHWLLENAFRNQMATSDFVLLCEGELVPCHRFVLRAASESFRGMLEAHTKEAREGKATIQCRGSVARALVTFLYTGELSDTHLQELLRLADMLLVEELGRRVEDRMVQVLGRENMVEFLLAGDTYHGARIRREAKAFIRANLGWLKGRQGWKEEFVGNLALIIELLE